MGKKSRKIVESSIKPFGTLLGHKHLGKPLSVGFGVYPLVDIDPVFEENSVEFNFTGLEYSPVIFPQWDAETSIYLDEKRNIDNALCFFLISDPSKIVYAAGDKAMLLVNDGLLPFKVGESRTWRDPRKGFLLEDDERIVAEQKKLLEFYEKALPGWGAFYTIEQVVDPAGLSDSLDLAVHKQIKTIVAS